jgi:hypothetical protein
MQRVRVRNFALPVVMAVHRIGGCSERPVNSPDSFRPDLMGRHVLCSYFVYGFCLPVVVFPAQDCQLGHPTSRVGFFFLPITHAAPAGWHYPFAEGYRVFMESNGNGN